jgi:hypothetical protein
MHMDVFQVTDKAAVAHHGQQITGKKEELPAVW